MTENTTTQATDSTEPAAGTLEHLDPHDLALGANVRDDAGLDAQFVASIKEHGVLAPIAAVRDADGRVWVRAGQRRTLAAREAGLATVPVYVRDATGEDAKAQLVQRVAEQIVENDQRAALTDAQRARGIQQMIDAGVSITRVAKKLSVPKGIVSAAAVAAASAAAMRGLAQGQLSLAEAAALTEFEDFPGAVERLTGAAGSRRFEHMVAQLRREKASWEAESHAAQGYIARGFSWLEQTPRSFDPDCIPLHSLRTADGGQADEAAVTDPPHWAVLLFESEAFVDVQTGEVVHEDDVDWDTTDRPDATPGDGLRHAATVTEACVFVPQYFCLDYRGAGLTPDPWFARNAGLHGAATPEGGDLDEDARQRAEAQRAEADKRERRKVLALNKLGEAAQAVRRDFLTKLLARRTPPKGAAIFVATCLSADAYLLAQHGAAEMTAELLGVPDAAAVATLAAELAATGDNRAQVITLGMVLGALESRTPKDAWRNTAGHCGGRVGSAEYLRWLAANDYPLAAVEEIVTGATDADTVHDRYLSDAGKD